MFPTVVDHTGSRLRFALAVAITFGLNWTAAPAAIFAQDDTARPTSVQVEMGVLQSVPLGKDADEQRILSVLDDLAKNQAARMMKIGRAHA